MNRKLPILFACLIAALILLSFHTGSPPREYSVSENNAANFGALLADLVNAYETPTASDPQTIREDLAAIRAVDRRDYAVAKAVADHWQAVYLDKSYRLFLYPGDDPASVLKEAGARNSRRHAIVVLGYALLNGEMQPELQARCDAAAAVARAFPEAIVVCSGGATGGNNPERHTEAGLMKQYLSERCGIDAARIFIDERAMTTAENAVNTFEILRENDVRTMTVVTSSYHQRWGQSLYNLLSALYRQRCGYSVGIVGNYGCVIENSGYSFRFDDRIAVRQMAAVLELPAESLSALP